MSKITDDSHGRRRKQILQWIEIEAWRSPNMFLCLATIRALKLKSKSNAWVRLVNEKTSKMADIRMVAKIATGWQRDVISFSGRQQNFIISLHGTQLLRRAKKYLQEVSTSSWMAKALVLDRFLVNIGPSGWIPSYHTMLSRTYDIKRYGLCPEQLEAMLWVQSRMDTCSEMSVIMCKDRAARRRCLASNTRFGEPYPKHPGSAYHWLDLVLDTNIMWGEQSETPLFSAETFNAIMFDVMVAVPPRSRRRFIAWFATTAKNRNYRCSDNVALVAQCRQILKTEIKNKSFKELENDNKV